MYIVCSRYEKIVNKLSVINLVDKSERTSIMKLRKQSIRFSTEKIIEDGGLS